MEEHQHPKQRDISDDELRYLFPRGESLQADAALRDTLPIEDELNYLYDRQRKLERAFIINSVVIIGFVIVEVIRDHRSS